MQKKDHVIWRWLVYTLAMLLTTCANHTPVVTRPLQLLFQRADHSLWLTPLNGDMGRQLTAALAPADDVVTWSLSPDQQWLAYIQVQHWRRDGVADQGMAWLLNIWTGEKRVLLAALLPSNYNWLIDHRDQDRAIIESEPVWSKDSQRFTLVSDHTGIVSLYLYELTTGELRLLTQGQHNIAWPQWSPDERYILYNDVDAFGTGAGPSGGALWVVRSAGPDLPRRLSQGNEEYELISAWVDNTHLITYKSSLAYGRTDWSTVDIDNGRRMATQVPPESSSSCWHYAIETQQLAIESDPILAARMDYCNAEPAPQGQVAYVLIESTMDHPSQLYLVDSTSGVKTLLAEEKSPNSAAFTPAWSPDGQYLIWLTPDNQSASAQNPDYDLWAAQVGQRRPFLVSKQVVEWGKQLWVK